MHQATTGGEGAPSNSTGGGSGAPGTSSGGGGAPGSSTYYLHAWTNWCQVLASRFTALTTSRSGAHAATGGLERADQAFPWIPSVKIQVRCGGGGGGERRGGGGGGGLRGGEPGGARRPPGARTSVWQRGLTSLQQAGQHRDDGTGASFRHPTWGYDAAQPGLAREISGKPDRLGLDRLAKRWIFIQMEQNRGDDILGPWLKPLK